TESATQPSIQSSKGARLTSFRSSSHLARRAEAKPVPWRSYPFTQTVVNHAFIAQDIQKYLSRSPLRRYWIVGEIRTGVVDQKRDMAGVTFRLRFAVQNDKKAVTGVCDDALLIMDASTSAENCCD